MNRRRFLATVAAILPSNLLAKLPIIKLSEHPHLWKFSNDGLFTKMYETVWGAWWPEDDIFTCYIIPPHEWVKLREGCVIPNRLAIDLSEFQAIKHGFKIPARADTRDMNGSPCAISLVRVDHKWAITKTIGVNNE